VPDLLKAVGQQASRERGAKDAELIGSPLTGRDQQLIDFLKVNGASAKMLRLAEQHLSADRDKRRPDSSVSRHIDLSDSGYALLVHLSERRLPDLTDQALRLVEDLAQVVREQEDVERAVAITPEDSDIGRIVELLKSTAQQLSVLEEAARRLDMIVQTRRAERAACESELQSLLKGKTEAEIGHEDQQRMMRLAGRTRETMQEFSRRATAQKIDRLSALITESFRFLLRKQTFIQRISVDPETFSITLYDETGRAIGKHRLSEVEKQIFAISVLWGLARASARQLPFIIDTPMARLDAAHRQNLIERYFPNASHQVIILSTDTEVDRRYYDVLQPSVARAFHLDYDEGERVTVAQEGYFWKEREPSASEG
jgi:DNA sulfur modification protein DndD